MASLVEDAYAGLNKGDFATARKLAEDIVGRSPADADANYILALIHFDGGNRAEAVQRLLSAIKARPAFADALNMLGLHYYQSREADAAEKYFRQAVAADDTHLQAHLNLASLLRDSLRFPAALTHVDAALRKAHHIAEAHVLRGECLLALHQTTDAFLAFKMAAAIDPNLFEAHFQLALLMTELRMFREAVSACQDALAIRPDDDACHKHLGLCLLECGRFEDGLRELRRSCGFIEFTPTGNSLPRIIFGDEGDIVVDLMDLIEDPIIPPAILQDAKQTPYRGD